VILRIAWKAGKARRTSTEDKGRRNIT